MLSKDHCPAALLFVILYLYMAIPSFPDFVPMSIDLKEEMHPKLSLTPDGVSEFTFAGLYLFRNRYKYRVSRHEDKTFIISGIQPPHSPDEKEKTFFIDRKSVV